MKQKSKSKFEIDEVVVVLALILLIFIIDIYPKSNKPKVEEAEKLSNLLTDDHGVSFASGGVIDQNKLQEVQNMDYNSLKKSLNAKNDFCVYVEDGNGNLILSKGSSKLNKDDINCRE